MKTPTVIALVALIASIGAIAIAQKQDHGFVAAPGATYDFTQGSPNLGFQRTTGDITANSLTSTNTGVDGSLQLCKAGGATCATLGLPATLGANSSVNLPDVNTAIYNDELNAFCTGTVNGTANTVVFLSPTGKGGGACNAAGNTTQAGMPVAFGGTARQMYVIVGTAPSGANTLTITLTVNGSTTALTCTVTGPASSCQDLTHSVAMNAGDRWGFQYQDSGAADATADIRVASRHQ